MDACAAKPRTKTGCWTCKRRRKKCDEGRPHCEACLAVGVSCEGYAKQLVWDNGIASRGKFAGAAVPSPEHAAHKPRGRARDKKRIPALDPGNSALSPESIFAQAQHADANDVQYSIEVTPQSASLFDTLFLDGVEEFESLRTSGENLNLEDQLMRECGLSISTRHPHASGTYSSPTSFHNWSPYSVLDEQRRQSNCSKCSTIVPLLANCTLDMYSIPSTYITSAIGTVPSLL